MKHRPSLFKAIAVATVLVLTAAACGGQADTASGDGGTDASAPVEATGDDDGGTSQVDATEGDGDEDASTGDAAQAAASQWEVSVLHVNDDVQIVPVFDEPDGVNITLYDVNAIDDVELEYPLFATTQFDNRLALLVQEFDVTGAWARVQVPVRPNGTTAWVQTSFFTEERHDYHITIDISENLVQLFKGDDPVPIVSQLAVVGSETLPTPLGRTYIDEKIPGAAFGPAYGPWVLSLAAFSESLGTVDGGGLPKMALHGTDQPEQIGESISSGSVRLPNEIIAFIAETVPAGTVVEIVA